MLMHISCIRTILLSLSYWYWSMLVLFYSSLSLSFSPFLTISCFITPKHKSTPSWDPLCFEASTSDSTPSHVWFHDKKARMDFSKNFSRHGFHSKCQVVLSDFSDIDLPTIIYSRGWESFCGTLVTCPSVIIQELYSNMHGIDTSIPHFLDRKSVV